MQNVTTDKLVQDLRVVIGDAEDLLKATAGQTGERVQQLRARAEESLRGAKAHLDEASAQFATRARDAARDVDGQVHAHPWAAVAMAAAVGLAAGLLIGRK